MDVETRTKSLLVIQALSWTIFVIITTAGVLHTYLHTNGVCRVHVAIAALFSFSGLLMRCYSKANCVYFVTGSLTWYGVFYCFISSDSHFMPHHYIQPEVLIAFLSFAGSLLTLPDIEDIKPMLFSPLYNSSGIVCLLLYFWMAESYFVEQKYDFFIDSIMSKMPPRLIDFKLFSDHRLSYSMVLISSHYCNILFLYVITVYSTSQENHLEVSEEDQSDAMNIDLSGRIQSKIDQIRIMKDDPTKTIVPTLRSKMNGVTSGSSRKIVQSESELPEDCFEISYEDAVLLSGGDSDDNTYVTDANVSAAANDHSDTIRHRKLFQGGV